MGRWRATRSSQRLTTELSDPRKGTHQELISLLWNMALLNLCVCVGGGGGGGRGTQNMHSSRECSKLANEKRIQLQHTYLQNVHKYAHTDAHTHMYLLGTLMLFGTPSSLGLAFRTSRTLFTFTMPCIRDSQVPVWTTAPWGGGGKGRRGAEGGGMKEREGRRNEI